MLLIYISTLFLWPIIISLILEVAIVMASYLGVNILTENQGLLLVNLSVYLILLISINLLYKNEIRNEFEKAKKKNIKFFLVYGLGLWIINLVIDNIVAFFGTSTPENQEIVDTLSATNYLISFVIFVFIGPVVEEIIFRYIIMNHFEQKRKYLGILISSFLFGVLHISTLNFGEFLMYFISGFYLGIIYYKSNNLIAPIGAHVFSNLINMLLMFIIILFCD